MNTLRDRWESQASNWVKIVRGRWRSTDHHGDFNFPSFLRVLPPPSGPTLEIGSGEGRNTVALRVGGYDIQGVDASPTMVAAARAADPHSRFDVADAADLPFEDESFALVIAFMSLQDMDDLGAVVAEAARVLQPGGHFCFAILHPLRTAGTWAGDGSFVLDSYFARRPYVVTDAHDDVSVEMWSEHRPLQAYSDALTAHGFVIEELREPEPFGDMIRSDGVGISEKWTRIPFAVHVRALKRPSGDNR